MADAIITPDSLPAVVYVQKGNYRGIAELFINASAEGALKREIGVGVVPGARVGIYKLDRIVQIKVGIQEIPQEPAILADPIPTTS